MSEEEAPAALMLKRGRGRPRKDDMRVVRPAKAVKACVGAVLQVYADDRNRAGKEWVEVAPRPAPRPVGRELSAEEQVSFLRCVASVRKMAHANSIAFRSPSSGQYETPQPVQLAAKFMGISEVTAKRIHAAFQESKVIPEGSARGVYDRAFLVQELFGQKYLESWTRIVVQRCIAVKKRPSYRDITAGIQELAVEQAREEGGLLGDDSVDEPFLQGVQQAMSYQRVRRWCRANKWMFKKITKVKGVVSDNPKAPCWPRAIALDCLTKSRRSILL